MTARFTQLDNNGWKLTNELGFILQDRCFSVVQAREVIQCSDCLCPAKTVSCLRIPCDLLESRCQNITLPLYDAKTRAPYKIQCGTLIENIIIMKRPCACLDDCMHFVLGTICSDECADQCSPQRWVSESCPISGAQLNKCCVIKVDATKRRNLDCDLFLCRANNSCNCEPVGGFSKRDGNGPCPGCPAGGDATPTDTSNKCDNQKDENGCPCVYFDGSGCCWFPGGCGEFAGGELADCMIGITLTGGNLLSEDILIAVESWQQCCLNPCGAQCDDPCAGVPRFTHGRSF